MEKDFRLYLVAKMYYVEHMRQNDIAKAMGISNMMVSRLLKRAEEEDVVTFNGIPFVPQKLRNFPAILEHRKIQTNPL